MTKIKVTKELIKQLIEDGYTRKDLANHFGVPVTQITKLIGRLGLKGTKAKKFDFEIEESNDITVGEASEIYQQNNEKLKTTLAELKANEPDEVEEEELEEVDA